MMFLYIFIVGVMIVAYSMMIYALGYNNGYNDCIEEREKSIEK